MKKLLTICAIMASFSSFSQQQQGDLSIQFSGNYYSQRIKFTDSEFRFGFGNLYVKMGKYFTDNLELGVKPNITFNLMPESTGTSGEPKTKSKLKTNVGFGLYGTYSFLTTDGKLLPYGGVELNYAPVDKESTINLGPYAGVKYFITEKINIDANLSFLMNLGSTYEVPKGDYDIGPLFTYNIGIGVLLGKINE